MIVVSPSHPKEIRLTNAYNTMLYDIMHVADTGGNEGVFKMIGANKNCSSLLALF